MFGNTQNYWRLYHASRRLNQSKERLLYGREDGPYHETRPRCQRQSSILGTTYRLRPNGDKRKAHHVQGRTIYRYQQNKQQSKRIEVQMEFALIWYSQYGKEEIDTTTDSQEAIRLRDEYQLAYGTGTVRIMIRPVKSK